MLQNKGFLVYHPITASNFVCYFVETQEQTGCCCGMVVAYMAGVA
jgi:hypothetical protein